MSQDAGSFVGSLLGKGPGHGCEVMDNCYGKKAKLFGFRIYYRSLS